MKVKESGVVSAGKVVTVNKPETPPTVSVVVVDVAGAAALAWRTHTDWLSLMVPGAAVNVPVQPMEYSPPATEIGAGALMPVIAAGAETTIVERSTFA